jgi:hypothetical protein
MILGMEATTRKDRGASGKIYLMMAYHEKNAEPRIMLAEKHDG